jgi:hypothetical protein
VRWSEDFFEQYDGFISFLFFAQVYAEKTREYDVSVDRYWSQRSEDFMVLTGPGRKNIKALTKLLAARRIMMIEAPVKKDLSLYQDALDLLREIRYEFPGWLSKLLETNIESCEEMLKKQ